MVEPWPYMYMGESGGYVRNGLIGLNMDLNLLKPMDTRRFGKRGNAMLFGKSDLGKGDEGGALDKRVQWVMTW